MSEETVLAKNFARFSDSGIAAYPQTARSHIQGLIGLCESKESELSLMREMVGSLEGLLGEIPKDYCPHCGDGSGGYPVPDGRGDFDIQQCQWCYEREALLSTGSAGG